MSMQLKGKTALVTGGSRGIGAAIAERLARDGAAVAVNYSRSAGEAEAVVARIKAAGGKATAHKADLSDPVQAKALVAAVLKEHGRLDILVNNAGMANFAPIEAVDEKHVRKHFALNVNGPIFATQAAAPHFPKEGGRVINVSSIVSTRAFSGASVYAATKAALDALTRIWAAELGPKGVTVNGVAPGPVDTDMMKAAVDAKTREYMVSRTPLGRVGVPADVAGLVAFLASPDGGWVTGETIAVSGGMTP